MKITTKPAPSIFTPVDIIFTAENQDELNRLAAIFRYGPNSDFLNQNYHDSIFNKIKAAGAATSDNLYHQYLDAIK